MAQQRPLKLLLISWLFLVIGLTTMNFRLVKLSLPFDSNFDLNYVSAFEWIQSEQKQQKDPVALSLSIVFTYDLSVHSQ